MKIKILTVAVIYALGVIYFALPTPSTPDLSQSVRSDEAGDTWQHPEQKGFYTNKTRAEVISEMQNKFAVKINSFTLPSYRLNYRPEETADFVREQVASNYLEEIVYPLRDSLFVNGWEPKNAPVNRNIDPKYIPGVLFKQTYYLSKVTLRPATSSVWARLFVWTLIFPATCMVFKSLSKTLKDAKT
jgi:hypothetical protein